MEVLRPDPFAAELRLTRDALLIINNALNEVCNGLSFDEDEFQTRIGHSRTMVQDLLRKVGKALAKK